MLRTRPLKLVLPLIVLLAGACAAPAASPPTAQPPTVAATAVPPTVAPTAVPPTLAPTAVPPTVAPTPAPTQDMLPLVSAFQAAYNQHDTDAVMALFVAEPNWTVSMGMFATVDGGGASGGVTAKAVREILDIGFALNSQLEASSCTMKKNGATCDWEFKDDCTPPAVSPYDVRAQIGFEDGKIASVFGNWASSDQIAFGPYDGARQTWARENLPAESATYFSYFPTMTRGAGVPPDMTVSEFGQAVDRICTGYAAVAP